MEEFVKSLTTEQMEKVLLLTLGVLEETGEICLNEDGTVTVFTEDGFEENILDVAEDECNG